MKIVTRAFMALFLLFTFAFTTAFATTSHTGSAQLLNTTPTQFSTTLGNVNHLVIRNAPGFCGKIFIGTSAMNTSTYAGVIKVLYPNCSGGIGDEYVLDDLSGTDGIDTSVFYIAEAYVVPGQSGKVHLGEFVTYNNQVTGGSLLLTYKILWPNTGQNQTDGWRMRTPDGGNGINSLWLSTVAEVSGEFPLVTVWRRQ